MRVQQLTSSRPGTWESAAPAADLPSMTGAQLVLAFGAPETLTAERLGELRQRFPRACITGCSTAGEIAGRHVLDQALVATAVAFDGVSVTSAAVEIARPEDSYEAGKALVADLPLEGLVHVFILSDGLNVNGSDLARGVNESLPPHIRATGGLSGDSGRFRQTLVVQGEQARSRRVVAVGFYGASLRVGYGSLGGWEPFGPERLVTRATSNVVYELDGQSALGLYKEYLGTYASGLPASGLLFPLSVRDPRSDISLTRTILGVDEATQSLTFAGDVPEGTLARLMYTNFDGLIDGAAGAARQCLDVARQVATSGQGLAVLISCVGRKLVLKQRIEEEVDAVIEVLGQGTCVTGFYSYGELAPLGATSPCALQNQTMTITTLREV